MSDQSRSMCNGIKDQKKKKKSKKIQKTNRFLKIFRRKSQDHQISEESQKPLRQVVVETRKLPQHPYENHHFITNAISTTKYTLVSNIYFLITAVLCFIPNFSPLPGYSALTPLAMKRRRTDKMTNNMQCKILHENKEKSGQNFENLNTLSNLNQNQGLHDLKSLFKQSLWSQVKCGDLIYVQEGEHFPADVVILMSSADNGECFVQTSTLDGERALKHKQCLVPIKKTMERVGINDLQFSIHCEAPSKNLYEFHGFIESEQLPEQGTVHLHPESKKRTITIDHKQIALRGSNLANTAWIIGAVIYTGKDTKVMLNQGNSRFKQSKIEKVVNVICVYLILIQAALCLVMSIYAGVYTSNYAEVNQGQLKRKAEYIFYTELQSNGKPSNGTDSIDYSPTLTGILTYGQYYILLNTLIPISLTISLEIVKAVQTPFIAHDIEMYDEEQMKQATPVSMILHEELASIKYIFADKTGTLTANIMQFQACSIGSVCYDEDYNEDDYEYEIDREQTAGKEDDEEQKQDQYDQKENSPQNQVIQEAKEEEEDEEKVQQFEQYKKNKGILFNEHGQESKLGRKNSVTKIVWNYTESARIIRNLLETKKYFDNEEINLGRSQSLGKDLILRKQNEYLHFFWLNIILCHDVIATHSNNDTRPLAYQGSSPDEITLLDAAKEVGYIFMDRTSDSMLVEIFGQQKRFKLLQKIDFSSDRKKMSVIIQDEEQGQIIVFSKGADLAIFDKLSSKIEQHFLEATKEDLIKFSTKGFRTLCFSMRVLDEGYFKMWQEKYETAKLENIKFIGLNKLKKEVIEENNISKLQTEIESDMFLLGATALEDKLQEGVPEVIEDFHSAGIKVWMLTGDKLETAENIGFSSKMFNEKMYIFKLQTTDKQNTRNRLLQIEQKILEIEKHHSMPIIGTQFILNPNAATDYGKKGRKNSGDNQISSDYEAKNIIRALEEFKLESKASEYTLNDSWARKPALRRKIRKRLEEIVPDKNAIVDRLIKENQIFYRREESQLQYIPASFDMSAHQYIVRSTNIYRSSSSIKNKDHNKHTTVDNEDTFGVLVEGQTLQFILDSESMKKRFLKILAKCQAVIVCRASPNQKGLVVNMIKESEPHTCTLAIGDGGNDVNMIQRAHIGIGIFGKEGYQAASNADYAIGQFRYLRRLLFVHGRWSGIRLSTFMLFFFNKNIIFTLPQFWFGWFNGYSGQTFFDDVYLTMFNTIVTSIAICTIGVWDQDINFGDEKTRNLIELFMPQIYRETQNNELFTIRKFLAWAAISVLQSIFVFGLPIFSYQELILEGGKIEDLWACSTCTYFAIVLLHYTLLCAFTKNWTIALFSFYFLSFLFFCPFLIITYNYMDYVLSNNNTYLRLYEIAFDNIFFWLMLLIILATCTIPLVFYYKAQGLLFPTLKDLILQGEMDYDEIMAQADPKKAKAAQELFKQKQQIILQKWQDEYQNFQHSPKQEEFLEEQKEEQKELEIDIEEVKLQEIQEHIESKQDKLKELRIMKKYHSNDRLLQSPSSDHHNKQSRKGRSAFKKEITNSSVHLTSQQSVHGIQQSHYRSQQFHHHFKDFIHNNHQHDIDSARSENFLNESAASSIDNNLNSKLRNSYLQEFDNDHKQKSIQVPNISNRSQPSIDNKKSVNRVYTHE